MQGQNPGEGSARDPLRRLNYTPRRPRRTWLILAAICAMALCAVLLARRDDDPVIEGKRLSTWILEAEDPNDEPYRLRALFKRNPETLRVLLRWIDYEPSTWRRSVTRVAISSPLPVCIVEPLIQDSRELRSMYAAWALQAFDESVTNIAPALIVLANNPKRLHTALTAQQALTQHAALKRYHSLVTNDYNVRGLERDNW